MRILETETTRIDRRTGRTAVLALLVAATFACGGRSPSQPTPPANGLRGGVLATFAVGTEQFKIWITNPTTISRVLILHAGGSGGSIPNGRIHRGSGQAQHNAPYSWHLDPADIELVDLAIEVCDGRPSYVEANVGEYVDRINRYCPWGARLTSFTDYR